MSIQFSTSQEQSQFTPTYLLDLFVLDGTAIGLSTIYYFCNATNQNLQPVVFNGISYTPFPIIMQDSAYDGKGTLPRPKLTVSNINGFISALLLQNAQLTGATVIRRRVFARFIDAVNFPGSLSPYTPDTSAAYPDDVWTVNRKITENQQIVQWELVSPIELTNVQLPRRQIIANDCLAPIKYRDTRTCGYTGLPVTDSSNIPFNGPPYNFVLIDQGMYNALTTYNQGDCTFIYSSLPQFAGIKIYYVCSINGTVGINPVGNTTNWINDVCTKTPGACSLRFTATPLRFGGYPGATRANWVLQV